MELTRADFEKRLRKLKDDASGKGRENPGSYACEGCVSCADCTFCTKSENLRGCHYMKDSSRCSECSHCVACTECHASLHCVASQRCTRSAYLVECTDCHECTYCFGCVGLSKKDFHILNEPFSRDDYFRLTKKLEGSRGSSR